MNVIKIKLKTINHTKEMELGSERWLEKSHYYVIHTKGNHEIHAYNNIYCKEMDCGTYSRFGDTKVLRYYFCPPHYADNKKRLEEDISSFNFCGKLNEASIDGTKERTRTSFEGSYEEE